MVQSLLRQTLFYPESKNVEPLDKNVSFDLFETEIHGVAVVIAVGNQHVHGTILFFPVYLVKPDNKVVQIGGLETQQKKENVDVESLLQKNDPLLYSFATPSFISSHAKKVDSDSDSDSDSTSDSDSEEMDLEEGNNKRNGLFVSTTDFSRPPLLREETEKEAVSQRNNYQPTSNDNWVMKFMKNPYYTLIDNEGSGDCFFATIRDAFSFIGQQTTVPQLRNRLAKEATQEVFENYREQYKLLHDSFQQDTDMIQSLKKEYEDMKTNYQDIPDRKEKSRLIDLAKQIKEKHDRLIQEFKFMKNVESLEAFQKKIKSSVFWADTWSISALERALNIKFIILSFVSFSAQPPDLDNVLQCGQMNDETTEPFRPDYYIVVAYTGNHYQLVGYRKRGVLRFSEIPFDLKRMVVDKCMETNAGLFSLIPDFRAFQKKMAFSQRGGKGRGKEKGVKGEKDQRNGNNHTERNNAFIPEHQIRDLYDDNVVLSFYAKSDPKPLPGKGLGEKITPFMFKQYSTLGTIPNWRKKLSHEWVQPFQLNNSTWNSVDHYLETSTSPTSKLDAVKAKFTQNEDLKNLLLFTHRAKLMHHVKGKIPQLEKELIIVRDQINNDTGKGSMVQGKE